MTLRFSIRCTDADTTTKSLHDCDSALLNDDRCLRNNQSSPFSAWCPRRGRGGRGAVGNQGSQERPGAQRAIASKLRRLYPSSTTLLAFDWRPMVERKTYRYISNNGCYRRFKSNPPSTGATPEKQCALSAEGTVEMKVRKYLRRFVNGWAAGGATAPAVGERSRRQMAAVARANARPSAEAGELVATVAAAPAAAATEASVRACVDRLAETASSGDSTPPAELDQSSPSSASGDSATLSEAARRLRQSGFGSEPPLQLPALFAHSALFGGAGSASDSQGCSLDIDRKLAMLNAELARDLALYDGGSSFDDLWSSALEPMACKVADNSHKSIATDDAHRDRIVGRVGMRRRATGAAAAERRIGGAGTARFSKLTYITREGDVVYVPVYRCVAVRTTTLTDVPPKRDCTGHLSVGATISVENALVDRPEAVAGVKYRLARRVAATESPATSSAVASRGAPDDHRRPHMYARTSRHAASLLSLRSFAPR